MSSITLSTESQSHVGGDDRLSRPTELGALEPIRRQAKAAAAFQSTAAPLRWPLHRARQCSCQPRRRRGRRRSSKT
eukprot:7386395-Prymnesium_polylepis.3